MSESSSRAYGGSTPNLCKPLPGASPACDSHWSPACGGRNALSTARQKGIDLRARLVKPLKAGWTPPTCMQREPLAAYYTNRSLEAYPAVTQLASLSQGMDAVARELEVGSPVVLWCMQQVARCSLALLSGQAAAGAGAEAAQTFRQGQTASPAAWATGQTPPAVSADAGLRGAAMPSSASEAGRAGGVITSAAQAGRRGGAASPAAQAGLDLVRLLGQMLLVMDIHLLDQAMSLVRCLVLDMPPAQRQAATAALHDVTTKSDDYARKIPLSRWMQQLVKDCSFRAQQASFAST